MKRMILVLIVMSLMLSVSSAQALDIAGFGSYSSPKSIVESNTTQILQSPK